MQKKLTKIRGIAKSKHGKVAVEILIQEQALIQFMGRRAAEGKTGVAQLAYGLVTANLCVPIAGES